MTSKKLIFVDLDDTVADFSGSPVFKGIYPLDISHMHEIGFFFNLKPIAGALVGVRALLLMGYEVQILSRPLAVSAHSYSEKVQWIGMWFPELINKVNFGQDKGLFKGDYLIDDSSVQWKDKFEANGGKFIYFDYHRDHQKNWNEIIEYFKSEAEQ